MLRLRAPAPEFSLPGALSGRIDRFALSDSRGRWRILFFYPADFTFICPTEMRAFQARRHDLSSMQCVLLAIGVDDVESHLAWAKELGGIDFPLLSDPDRTVCRGYDVLDEEEDRPYRATFVVAPDGRIAYLTVSPSNVGRSVEDTLRVLQALQTGRLCPADWHPGQATFDVELTR
jgi:peroxiredoxin 2/4